MNPSLGKFIKNIFDYDMDKKDMIRQIKGYELTKNGKYQVRFTINKQKIYIGVFNTIDEAQSAYKVAYKEYTGMNNPYDLIDKKFGKLTVIGYAGKTKSGTSHKWVCACDCGKTIRVRVANLNNKNTQSCGCYRIQRTKETMTKGYAEASFNKVLKYYKTNAARKNLEFNLNPSEFKTIIMKDCHYCGVQPAAYFKKDFANGNFIYNGIDRKDNNEGYTLNNSLPCCNIWNRAKSALMYDEFISYTQRFTI